MNSINKINSAGFAEMDDCELYEVVGGGVPLAIAFLVANAVIFGWGVYNGYQEAARQG